METQSVNMFRPFKDRRCRNCSQPFNSENDIFKSFSRDSRAMVTTCTHCKRKNSLHIQTGELKLITRKQEKVLKEIAPIKGVHKFFKGREEKRKERKNKRG